MLHAPPLSFSESASAYFYILITAIHCFLSGPPLDCKLLEGRRTWLFAASCVPRIWHIVDVGKYSFKVVS